jgi:hypothetical protein
MQINSGTTINELEEFNHHDTSNFSKTINSVFNKTGSLSKTDLSRTSGGGIRDISKMHPEDRTRMDQKPPIRGGYSSLKNEKVSI